VFYISLEKGPKGLLRLLPLHASASEGDLKVIDHDPERELFPVTEESIIGYDSYPSLCVDLESGDMDRNGIVKSPVRTESKVNFTLNGIGKVISIQVQVLYFS
jgi:hypothetical protein